MYHQQVNVVYVWETSTLQPEFLLSDVLTVEKFQPFLCQATTGDLNDLGRRAVYTSTETSSTLFHALARRFN